MATCKSAAVMILIKLAYSEDEKPCRGKTREWIKRRSKTGYFQNIFQDLKVEDRMGFQDMFAMNVTDYKFLLIQISDLTLLNERISGNRPILAENFKIFCCM